MKYKITYTPSAGGTGPGEYSVKIPGGTMRSSLDGIILWLTDGPLGMTLSEAMEACDLARRSALAGAR